LPASRNDGEGSRELPTEVISRAVTVCTAVRYESDTVNEIVMIARSERIITKQNGSNRRIWKALKRVVK
jgi:hypothetical protein